MQVDEMLEFCVRVLGPVPAARDAAATVQKLADAWGEPERARVALLTAASNACRARAEGEFAGIAVAEPPDDETLTAAVSRELAVATAALPERQREVLALREALRLSYADIASVMGIGELAVAPLLCRARLRLSCTTPSRPRRASTNGW
jgi:DNA-directed RNA polymerase specialized sigma24 family protein